MGEVSLANLSHVGKDTSSKVISVMIIAVSCSNLLIFKSVGIGNILINLNILLSGSCSVILIIGVLNFEPFGNMMLHPVLNEASPIPSISIVSSVYFSCSRNSLHFMYNFVLADIEKIVEFPLIQKKGVGVCAVSFNGHFIDWLVYEVITQLQLDKMGLVSDVFTHLSGSSVHFWYSKSVREMYSEPDFEMAILVASSSGMNVLLSAKTTLQKWKM